MRECKCMREYSNVWRQMKIFCGMKRRGEYYFNDALRFIILFHTSRLEDHEFGIQLNNILESNMKELGLNKSCSGWRA